MLQRQIALKDDIAFAALPERPAASELSIEGLTDLLRKGGCEVHEPARTLADLERQGALSAGRKRSLRSAAALLSVCKTPDQVRCLDEDSNVARGVHAAEVGYVAVKTALNGNEVCEDDPWARAWQAATCSGFLLDPLAVGTAAHCVPSDGEGARRVDELRVVFDFGSHGETEVGYRVPPDTVRKLTHALNASGEWCEPDAPCDWAVLLLSSPVLDRAPVALQEDAPSRRHEGVYITGSPWGLATRLASATYAGIAPNTDEEDQLVSVTGPVYPHNSGSAVFDAETDQVVGIVVQWNDPTTVVSSLGDCDLPNPDARVDVYRTPLFAAEVAQLLESLRIIRAQLSFRASEQVTDARKVAVANPPPKFQAFKDAVATAKQWAAADPFTLAHQVELAIIQYQGWAVMRDHPKEAKLAGWPYMSERAARVWLENSVATLDHMMATQGLVGPEVSRAAWNRAAALALLHERDGVIDESHFQEVARAVDAAISTAPVKYTLGLEEDTDLAAFAADPRGKEYIAVKKGELRQLSTADALAFFWIPDDAAPKADPSAVARADRERAKGVGRLQAAEAKPSLAASALQRALVANPWDALARDLLAESYLRIASSYDNAVRLVGSEMAAKLLAAGDLVQDQQQQRRRGLLLAWSEALRGQPEACFADAVKSATIDREMESTLEKWLGKEELDRLRTMPDGTPGTCGPGGEGTAPGPL